MHGADLPTWSGPGRRRSGGGCVAGRRGPGSVLLDVVVVLALIGFALIGLATTFVSWQYLVVGLVAAVRVR